MRVIQNRSVSTGRLGPCERPGSVIGDRPSEYGPSGPYERPVRGHVENPSGNLDNVSISAGTVHARCGENQNVNLNNTNFG